MLVKSLLTLESGEDLWEGGFITYLRKSVPGAGFSIYPSRRENEASMVLSLVKNSARLCTSFGSPMGPAGSRLYKVTSYIRQAASAVALATPGTMGGSGEPGTKAWPRTSRLKSTRSPSS